MLSISDQKDAGKQEVRKSKLGQFFSLPKNQWSVEKKEKKAKEKKMLFCWEHLASHVL